jgi:hypothetical protein
VRALAAVIAEIEDGRRTLAWENLDDVSAG